jgi:hypothetical protein
LGDSVEVQRRQSSPQEVDNAVTAIDAQVMRTRDISGRKHLAITQPRAANALQKAQDRSVGFRAVGHEQVAVLRRTNMTVVDHAKAADHDVREPDRLGIGDDSG